MGLFRKSGYERQLEVSATQLAEAKKRAQVHQVQQAVADRKQEHTERQQRETQEIL